MRHTAFAGMLLAGAAMLASSIAAQATPSKPGPYPRAQMAIGVYKSEKACQTPAYDTAMEALRQIDTELAGITQPGTPRGIDLRFEQYTAYFDLADSARAKHCWDQAESLYRAVLRQYANMNYQHPQDRAQSSLDSMQKDRARAEAGR